MFDQGGAKGYHRDDMHSKVTQIGFIVAVLAAAAWLLWPSRVPMPAVQLALTDGQTLSTADIRGKPLLIYFWSVSCAVCIRDMPKLSRLQESLADRDLLVIGVAAAYDPPATVIELAKQLAPGFPIALDPRGEISAAFGGIAATPTSFLVNRDGNIVHSNRGPLDELRIRATLVTF